ncbi:uncharacterized protein F13E9.13, mitochondrial [Daktulosphaira vitifoliae]|uniref:uncharacterized protein F13E9.13, mitochondrial n=1 Tax=Daktulosphaira vitifoliae TaxID=58002 RepID=UPI0021A9C1A9|nr:uncharacterized protein F13E9.13, mitochondrial [Daktulosphaira vitifoliae]
MNSLKKIFTRKTNNVFGMIHVKALPGTPLFKGNVNKIVDDACREAEIYSKCGIDGIVVENMHDVPYIHAQYVGPEIVSMMTRICSSIRKIVPHNIPCGLQILAAANEEALAVAQTSNFQFIRAEGFIFGHVADEGYIDACAGKLLRYRKTIEAQDICIFTDIKKKHSSHAITQDVSLIETAKAATFFLSDGIIVTGNATGHPAEPQDVLDVKQSVQVPVLVGSGITVCNVHKYLGVDGFIIGSHFKQSGKWENELDETSIKNLMNRINEF